jgi:CDP-diacylglycerol--glycerol-3-phosphate 3-phosphatidyltransferase
VTRVVEPWRGRGAAIDLYRVKPAIVQALEPVLGRLQRSGVTPDSLTLAAIPVGAVGGLAVLASPTVPGALLLVPVVAATRLVLNLLDGSLARRTGQMHPRGELYNEVGDRVADVLMLAPVALVPGAVAPAVWLGVVLAVLASFVSVTTRAAGGTRSYRGMLSKPGRMVLLSASAILVVVVGPGGWLWFSILLVLGTCATFAERVLVGIRELP